MVEDFPEPAAGRSIVVLINIFRLGMGAHANPQIICHKASTRPHIIDKYCTGGYYKRLREQFPFWGCQDFIDVRQRSMAD